MRLVMADSKKRPVAWYEERNRISPQQANPEPLKVGTSLKEAPPHHNLNDDATSFMIEWAEARRALQLETVAPEDVY